MVMRIGVTANDTDIRLATSFRTRSLILKEKLLEKMSFLMTELQAKARKYQTMSASKEPSIRVQDSIKDPEAHQEGDLVVGTLQWGNVPVEYMSGEVYDLAQILEHGAKPHRISPIATREAGLSKLPAHYRKGVKERFGTGSPLLVWQNNGKNVFRRFADHPGIPATNFMANAIEDMKAEIKEQLRAVTLDALQPE